MQGLLRSRSGVRLRNTLVASAVVLLGGSAVAQPAAPAQLRHAGFVAINVAELAPMLAFYTAIGLAQEFRRDTEAGAQIGLGLPAQGGIIGPNLLLVATKDARPNPGSVLSRVAWAVKDVSLVCRRVTMVAGKDCQPRDNPTNKTRIAFTVDPDGNRVELIENY